MSDEIDVRVSLDLDPEAVFATIEDYDDDTASYLSPAKTAFTEAYSALRAVHDAKAAAEDDPTLNDAGRLLKVDDYASKRMLAKVYPAWDAASSSLNSKVEAWEKEMTKSVESKASQMISGEIRAHFKSLKTGERMTAISQAIKDGDELVASAVLGGPGMLSGIDEEMRSVLVREYHEKFNAPMAKRLRAAKSGLAQIDGKLGLLRREVTKAVGTIKIKGPNFEMHGQYDGEITPAQLRAKRDKSNKPFAL